MYNQDMKKFKTILFYITILLLVFIISANVTHYDFDLWARLIAGMGVIDGHQVLKTDFLSYTPTHTWWDHEYGSGVVFYFFLKHFGAYSLIILQTILFFLIFITVVQIVKLRGIKRPYNMLFYLFPIIALAANFGYPIRCHLFSFLFFAIFIYILELTRKGHEKLIYVLPPLVIVWNNLHGGVVAGLGLIAMYGLGQILDKKPFKHYIIAEILSFTVLIINPWGWEYIKFLLSANSMQRPHIAEWWGLFSKHQLHNQIPFKIFMFLALCLEFIKLTTQYKTAGKINDLWKELDKSKLILLATTLILAIKHVKLLPFFAIAASAYCYEDFHVIVAGKLPKWSESFICSLVFAVCLMGIFIKKYDIPLGDAAYPHRETEFIRINNIKGKVLVNFGLGSFVSYKLYPNNTIYMDGRYEEVYYDDLIPLLEKFYLVKPGWDEVLEKYPPDILIIEKYYPVYQMLNIDRRWVNIYEAEVFAVFIKKAMVKKNYVQPTNSKDYYKNTLFDTEIKF